MCQLFFFFSKCSFSIATPSLRVPHYKTQKPRPGGPLVAPLFRNPCLLVKSPWALCPSPNFFWEIGLSGSFFSTHAHAFPLILDVIFSDLGVFCRCGAPFPFSGIKSPFFFLFSLLNVLRYLILMLIFSSFDDFRA